MATAESADTIQLPTNGRSTLRDQGKSLIDVTNPEAPQEAAVNQPKPKADDAKPVEAKIPTPNVARTRDLIARTGIQSADADDAAYGEAKVRFERIASHAEAILGDTVSDAQIAQLLIGVELAKITHDPSNAASWSEIVSLAAVGAERTGAK